MRPQSRFATDRPGGIIAAPGHRSHVPDLQPHDGALLPRLWRELDKLVKGSPERYQSGAGEDLTHNRRMMQLAPLGLPRPSPAVVRCRPPAPKTRSPTCAPSISTCTRRLP